jgi:tetratricopeptide (TPR) repeat protein
MPHAAESPGAPPFGYSPAPMSLARRTSLSSAIARLALLAAAGVCTPAVAHADPPRPVTSPEAAAAARQHFAHARELYQQGAYREAIGELDAALALDPNAKDLVFNLGVVHEKLGDIEDALKYFRQYETMDLDAQERAKADAYVKRLAGARHEVEKPPEPVAVTPAPTPPPPPPPPQHGRIDVFTIGAASLAVAGYGVGVFFGLRALSERPKAGFVTGRDGSYTQLQNDANTAHHAAIVSDVGFAAGVVATGLAAYLYFGRTRPTSSDGRDGGKTGDREPPVVLYGTAIPRGGALFLGARF